MQNNGALSPNDQWTRVGAPGSKSEMALDVALKAP
jgi:hypothetical protein